MLIYVTLLAVIIVAYMRFETTRLAKERIIFTNDYHEDLKIIQLSDIHLKYMKVKRKKIRMIIEDEDPDLIVFTGDYIDDRKSINDFVDFAGYLVSGYRSFAVPGNHDIDSLAENDLFEKFTEQLHNKDIILLRNKSTTLRKGSLSYNLTCIDDLGRGDADIEKSFTGLDPDADLNLAISHNPDVIFHLSGKKLDLLMCGHFHGGQIWMPFKLEFKILRKEKLPHMGVTRGLHRVNDIMLYINRGLGNVCFPLRFMSVPEITIFEFKKG